MSDGRLFDGLSLPRRCFFFRVVLDGRSFDEEHHVLPDVGGQVSDAFEVTAHEREFHRGADGVRVFGHMGEKDPEERAKGVGQAGPDGRGGIASLREGGQIAALR